MNFAKLDKRIPTLITSKLNIFSNSSDGQNSNQGNVAFTRLRNNDQDEVVEQITTNHEDQFNIDTHNNFENNGSSIISTKLIRFKQIILKYSKFIGPGLMVSVSYMDPGNYSTAVAAGSALQYKLLFSVLLSNILAAFLQILCAKLGAVTGLDLAQNCRKHLPHRLNVGVYILAEIAIVATDLAEVIGTAISLNILFGLPLLLGVVFTIIDVLIVLLAYKPNGDMKIIRLFEGFVSILVVLTVVCFAIELSTVEFNTAEVFKGYLPSKELINNEASLYLSLSILGATVMPHSLYLGSGLVQSRLKEFDIKMGNFKPIANEQEEEEEEEVYKPSLRAINETMDYTIAELMVSLFTVALFVNSAILIVAGSTLYGEKDTDLFSIYELLTKHLSKFAGLIFVLALLFSGQSAGIVCTLAGQMVSEGFLHWTIPPTTRRLITRSIAILPCFIVVLFSGREGLSDALNASQIVLSFLLPFVSAPLLWFTSNKNIMKVRLDNICSNDDEYELRNLNIDEQDEELNAEIKYKDMSNTKFTNGLAVCVWCFISFLNFFLLYSLAIGKDISL